MLSGVLPVDHVTFLFICHLLPFWTWLVFRRFGLVSVFLRGLDGVASSICWHCPWGSRPCWLCVPQCSCLVPCHSSWETLPGALYKILKKKTQLDDHSSDMSAKVNALHLIYMHFIRTSKEGSCGPTVAWAVFVPCGEAAYCDCFDWKLAAGFKSWLYHLT